MDQDQNPQISPVETFQELDLHDATFQALEHMGFETPSPIQAAFIPIALTGKDCTGQARTGTGKTAAFVIPILEQIRRDVKVPQALILVPTRELSEQVAVEAKKLSKNSPVKSAVIVGGRPINAQIKRLKEGVQIVVGTPGRVIDLIQRGALDLKTIQIAVLDEADRMLDIGFRPDIERILRRCPEQRQTLLLSATMPGPVERLAQKYMKNPLRVDLSEDQVAVDHIRQFYVTVDPKKKATALARVLAKEKPTQALVFTRTKRGADKLHQKFSRKLPKVSMIHGDLPQYKRDRVMKQFRAGEIRLLIATDVVGRGIDISGISHIVNYDIPEHCDDYVHRIGRTGRLSSDETGSAFTFVTQEQGEELTRIEMRINMIIEEYKIDSVQTYTPTERKTVDDVKEVEIDNVNEEDFAAAI